MNEVSVPESAAKFVSGAESEPTATQTETGERPSNPWDYLRKELAGAQESFRILEESAYEKPLNDFETEYLESMKGYVSGLQELVRNPKACRKHCEARLAELFGRLGHGMEPWEMDELVDLDYAVSGKDPSLIKATLQNFSDRIKGAEQNLRY